MPLLLILSCRYFQLLERSFLKKLILKQSHALMNEVAGNTVSNLMHFLFRPCKVYHLYFLGRAIFSFYNRSRECSADNSGFRLICLRSPHQLYVCVSKTIRMLVKKAFYLTCPYWHTAPKVNKSNIYRIISGEY